MKHSETAAFPPPRPSPSASASETNTATLIAPPIAQVPVAQVPIAQTIVEQTGSLPSAEQTIAVPGAGAGADATVRSTIPPGATRGHATVLPDVRSEGDRLIIVPRNQTRYQNDQLLGRGGMGEVKLARDHDIGRNVAVKRLLDEDNPQSVARFIDEVRTVGALEHPNIVPIHDVGVDEDGSYFFVMKYVEGETLGSIIDKLRAGDAAYHKRYSYEVRLDFFVGLLRALQYAHARGLVHRDVKPDNIMVGRYGEVVLMDWGIAHHMRSEEARVTHQSPDAPLSSLAIDRASTETVDGAVIGTPRYMSPEQAAGQVAELDGRSDLYSACVVLYELLMLRPYIEPGQSPMQTVLRALEREAPPPSDPSYSEPSANPSAVPLEWRHFFANALINDRDQRYQTADEMLTTVESIRSGDFIACPLTYIKASTTRMERFMDRYPMQTMALTMAAMLMFLGGAAGWIMWALA